MDPISLALLGISTIGSTAGVTYGIAQEKGLLTRKERATVLAWRRQVLNGAYILRSNTEQHLSVPKGSGEIVWVWAGTFPAQQGPQMFKAFQATDTGSFVGPTLWIEPDQVSLRDRAPHVPDEFTSRLEVAKFPLLRGGFAGRTIPEVLDPQFLPYWLPDLKNHITEWLAAIRRHHEPVMLVVMVSPGPSGVTGWPAIEAFHDEHPQVPICCVIVLDEYDDRRELHVPPLLDLYGQGKVVKGFIVADNRREPQLFDEALAALFPAMIQGALLEPHPKLPWNWATDLFRYHRVATLRAAKGLLAVTHIPSWRDLPELWCTNASLLRIQALRAVQRVLSNPALQSLPLEIASKPWLTYITTPLRPDPDALALGQDLRGAALHGSAVKLFTVSMASDLTKDTTGEELLAAILLPVQGDLKAVKDLALGKRTIDPKFQTNGSMRGNNHAEAAKEVLDS